MRHKLDGADRTAQSNLRPIPTPALPRSEEFAPGEVLAASGILVAGARRTEIVSLAIELSCLWIVWMVTLSSS